MASDGKQLESLVAFVEKTLLPEGFKVSTNERVFNDEGVQIAEFDIEIHGKVGSTDISWLIECRDRPTSGPAPGSWIEQLVGRRTRFGFNKVTAVSTTGFSTGATEFAISEGIELREVQSLDPKEFSDWLYIRHIYQKERITKLEHATIYMEESEGGIQKSALEEFLKSVSGDVPFLKTSTTGEVTTPALAFSSAAGGIDGMFDDLPINGPEEPAKLHAKYTDEDHYIIETSEGPTKIRSIIFEGSVRIKQIEIPIFAASEYKRLESGEVISQVASFAPQTIHGIKFSTEMHKMSESGETHIILRRLDDNT